MKLSLPLISIPIISIITLLSIPYPLRQAGRKKQAPAESQSASHIGTCINSLIERIEIHNNDKSSGHCYVKVDIYFTAVGMIDIPAGQEILAMMEEIRENPQDFRFVA